MHWKKSKWRLILVSVFFLAICLRLFFSLSPGEYTDLMFYQNWSYVATNFSITKIYSVVTNCLYTPANYPPVFLYLLGFVGLIYKNFFSANFQFNTPILFFLIKFFPILADIVIGLVLYIFSSSYISKRAGILASAFWLFNPAIIYNSSVWGQSDSILMLFLLVAVFFIARGEFGYAWIFYSLSLLTKQQTLIFLPLMIFFTLWQGGKKELQKGMIILIVTTFILLFPFIISGEFFNFLRNILSTLTQYPVLSKNAFNFWWLLFGKEALVISDQKTFLYIYSAMSFGSAVFVLIYLYVLKILKKANVNTKLIILAFLIISLSFFIFPTEIHERYLYYSIPFVLMLGFWDKKLKPIFFVLSITLMLNLLYSLPMFNIHLDLGLITRFISLINVSTLGYLLIVISPKSQLFKKLSLKKSSNK